MARWVKTFERSLSQRECGQPGLTTWALYSYTATLATPFNAAASTRYWLSIQANTPSYRPFWGWRDGTPDNGSSVQLFNNAFTNFAVDRAYTLRP